MKSVSWKGSVRSKSSSRAVSTPTATTSPTSGRTVLAPCTPKAVRPPSSRPASISTHSWSYIVKKATGDKIDLGPIFEHQFGLLGRPEFGVKLGWENDFDLRGELMLQEDFYFTPEVYCTMTTSFGQTIKAKAGEKVEFNTPEGEGRFTVDAIYRTEADLRTVISLRGDLAFLYKILDFEIKAGIHVGPIDFDFGSFDPDPVLEGKLSLGLGFEIPIYSNTDHFVFDTIRKHSFAVAYEKFRTVGGSGDSWTLTTHQIIADGNGRANRFVGNTLRQHHERARRQRHLHRAPRRRPARRRRRQ